MSPHKIPLVIFTGVLTAGALATPVYAGSSQPAGCIKELEMSLDQAENKVEWPAEVRNTAAIEVIYSFITEDGVLPGAIELFLHPGDKLSDQNRILVQRLIPFGPADKKGLRRAVALIPPEVVAHFNSENLGTAIAEITFDPAAAVPESVSSTLTLQSARIIALK